MPTLATLDLSQEVYDLLKVKAVLEERSVEEEAALLISEALHAVPSNKERRRRLLEELRQDPILKNDKAFSPPEVLVREDRER